MATLRPKFNLLIGMPKKAHTLLSSAQSEFDIIFTAFEKTSRRERHLFSLLILKIKMRNELHFRVLFWDKFNYDASEEV